MDFINAVRSGFVNYAVFEGRANRPMFWWWVLFSSIVGLVVSESDLLSLLVNLALLVPSISVGARRMHDIGRSGWWQIVPFYNIYLAVQPGDPGMNAYGPPAPPLRYEA
jgi:uncharacterized membrane protein YhaH (DUF805 family)